MLDIDSIQEVAEAEVQLRHPVTKAPLGAFVTLAGPEHPKRRAIAFERQRRVRAGLQKTGRIQLDDPEQSAEEDLAFLAACTLGWKGLAHGGAAIPYSETAAADLYSRPELAWLRAQVMEALNERENFIRGSSQP